MQERTFLSAMLFHTRVIGERLPHFRDEVKSLSLEDKQWFVEQFACEFGIEITENRGHESAGLVTALVHVPQTQTVSFVKEYLDA